MALPATWTDPSTEEQAVGAVVPAARLNKILGDLKLLAGAGGPVWVDWTPTWTQAAAVSKTVDYARYTILGKTAIVQIQMSSTGAGTAGNPVVVGGIPAAIAPKQQGGDALHLCGLFGYYDAGTGYLVGYVFAGAATYFQFMLSGAAGSLGVASPTVANGDSIMFIAVYEIA